MKLLSLPGLSHKAVAGVLVGVLAVGTAVGTFASQDMLPSQSQDSPSTQTVDDGQGDNGDGDNNDNGAGQRDIVGIPEDNPNHQPDEGDDDCEKGETAVKTTPSGKQVNVPCHAVEPGPPTFSQGQQGDADSDDGDDGAGRRDVAGIPEDNPNHQPDDGDDGCEKGETAVKTTPSGKQVNVPCHAVEPGPPPFIGSHNGDEGDDG